MHTHTDAIDDDDVAIFHPSVHPSETVPLHQLPHAGAPPLLRNLTLAQVICRQTKPAPILSIKVRDIANINLLTRGAKIDPLDIEPPDFPVCVKGNLFGIAAIAPADVECHDVRFPFPVALVVPVRAVDRKREAYRGGLARVIDLDMQLRGLEGAGGDAELAGGGAVDLQTPACVV